MRPSRRSLSVPCIALAALVPMLPAAALAKPEACLTSLEGFPTALAYDTGDEEVRANRSIRERWLGGYGRITCPGYVTLRAMTPGLNDRERSVFCLQFDREANTYTGFAEGKRDAYLHCAKPSGAFCEKVNASAETAGKVAGAAGTALNGVRAVENSAGAVVLSGTTGSVSAALSNLGATALATVTAPAALTAAAVTVVAVGGAVYVCSE
ncbi:hypothetical protein ORIO_02780 [Cereibacter azotoformans]|uniref:Uncharacterized protein n=1 Tax=Cereibacter sphaeroides (strain ATCC 17025 / ATH 2.4.3) TaxID=349102 RepID=A4WPZ1_CERS5|nr:hypothetical protein [Cereibacter azotoformans]ULB08856.1 hypothetical protein ORIO_02780 [Cereibacter azotoformans]